MQELAFRTLLYRYFFFDWLFKDVSAARNVIERHAALGQPLERGVASGKKSAAGGAGLASELLDSRR